MDAANPQQGNPEFADFDLHLEYLIQQDHPRIMNLEKRIPPSYPWDLLLEKHFGRPPFELTREDLDVVIESGKKVFRIQETRKPTTFLSLFRFLELFRRSLRQLEENLAKIESQYDRVSKTKHENTGLRGLLRKQWTADMIENKHEIIAQSFKRDSNVDSVMEKLQSVLAENLPVTSRWQYMLEPFVKEVITHVNQNFKDGAFNLRMYFPVRSMEEKLKPYYSNAMRYVVELMDAVSVTNAVAGRL